MSLDITDAKRWMVALNDMLQENKSYLTELDQAIGDGDHGLNMARGFQEVVHKVSATEYEDLGSIFKDVGMTLISKVGGASGPLYGTAFLKIAMQLKGLKSAEIPDLARAFSEALEGVKGRGRAQLGDKTMIDVWEPVTGFLAEVGSNVVLDDLIKLATEKAESTKELEARKGRSAYLGKRSIGHIDPGAVSTLYLFNTLAKVLKGDQVHE